VNFSDLPIGRGRKVGDDIRASWGDFPVGGEIWTVEG
jgi:hypothetical protein